MKLDKIINSNMVNNIEKIVIDHLPINGEEKAILQRRINKLKRDPKIFIKDSYTKRKQQVHQHLPIKHTGNFQYTVISAVYNVEKYLDDYFKSLVNQSLDFKKHIHLILVDDGSTDNSAQIIKKWQKKYPKNIHYYYKANGGQASARNLGLEYVKTEWVTFIDSDDYVGADYFKNFDNELVKNASIIMLVGNTKMFQEAKNTIEDIHPLRFRFQEENKIIKVRNLGKNINLSVAASVFRTDLIRNFGVQFNQDIKPNFEDGKFIADYLLQCDDDLSVVHIKSSVYFYRKREDGSSTLDGAWQKPEKFDNVLRHGFLSMLAKYEARYGRIPVNIQNTVLYDLSWFIKYLLNKPEKIEFLTTEQKETFFQLFQQCFDHIDFKTIQDFNLAGVWFFHKVGMWGRFKNQKPPFQICYIKDIDREKRLLLVSYFTYFDISCSFRLNEQDVVPQYFKTMVNSFNGTMFVKEVQAWIPYDETQKQQQLQVWLDGRSARLAVKRLAHKPSFSIQDLLKAFEPRSQYQSDGSWLMMDRETKADDNAEHFYRYMMQNHPKQCCYFALKKDSVDWQRLKDEGFHLVEFGTSEYVKCLQKASTIISSHIEAPIHNYFGDLYDHSKKFIFLQHGVTKDDLSVWLNNKDRISKLVTATYDEYRSLIGGERYRFTKKEVILTGFPRYDSLYQKWRTNMRTNKTKTILIMPTWRSYLMGMQVGKGANLRTLNPQFFDSAYATHWTSLLLSQKLRDLTDEYGYYVLFIPHANIEPYLKQMTIPEYIDIWSPSKSNISIQDIFVQADLMITDYSSAAFEMAYIGKPTLYYQFDKDEFFSGSHTYQKGYFSYENDGFGSVVYNKQSLFMELEFLLKNNGKPTEPYLSRIENVFPFRDDKNCERVYQAVLALDKSDNNQINLEILQDYLKTAYEYQSWDLVISRAKLMIEYGDEEQKAWANELLFDAFMQQNRYVEAKYWLESFDGKDCIRYQKIYLIELGKWSDYLALIGDIHSDVSVDGLLAQFESYAHLDRMDVLKILSKKIQYNQLSKIQIDMLYAWKCLANKQWQEIVDVLEKMIVEINRVELKRYKPELLLSCAYRELKLYDDAHKMLVSFEKHTHNHPRCRIQIASLAYARGNFPKCIVQYNKAWDLLDVDADNAYKYADSLYQTQKYNDVVVFLSSQSEHLDEKEGLQIMYVNSLCKIQKWRDVINFMEKHGSEMSAQAQDRVLYANILARYRLGIIEEAYQLVRQPTFKDSYEYWELVAETAVLVEDKDLAKYCYRNMVTFFPDLNKAENINKLILMGEK